MEKTKINQNLLDCLEAILEEVSNPGDESWSSEVRELRKKRIADARYLVIRAKELKREGI